MALEATQVSVTNVAVRVVAPVPGAQDVIVYNRGSAVCYLGGSSTALSSSTGFQLDNAQYQPIRMPVGGQQLWAVCAGANSTTLHVIASVDV